MLHFNTSLKILILNNLTKINARVKSYYHFKIINEIELRLKGLNIHISLTNTAKEELISTGYDINYGARPLKRCVSRIIESKLAKMIIKNEIKENDNLIIDFKDNDFLVKKD